jgi:hypothetical protein
MFRYLIPWLNFLTLVIGGWLFFSQRSGLRWWLLVSLVVIIISGRFIAQYDFWRRRWLWLNLLLVYFSQILFLLLITSSQMRHLLLLFLALLWWFVWWLLSKYFNRKVKVNNKDYWSFNIFLYSLGFWFLSSSFYSLVIFLGFPIVYAWLIILLAAWLWSREIFSLAEGVSHWSGVFLIFGLVQILVVLYFLPVSFYVAGTIATLYFFWLVDSLTNKQRNFKIYLILFFASFSLLLLSSIIY